MDIERRPQETTFEWKLRLCLAKKRKEIDLDWQEIVDILNLKITPDQLRKQSVGYEEYDRYLKGMESGETTILSLSDLHIPFQLPIEKLADYQNNINILQLNGDLFDCYNSSKFVKLYRISPIEELIIGRDYLIKLVRYLNPQRVVVNYGNHCLRLGNYLAAKLDNELQELMPLTVLDYIFEDGFNHYDRKMGRKIHYDPVGELFPHIKFEYTHTWFSQIGDTIFAHPKTFSSSPMKTAEKAMNWFRNEGYSFKNLVMSHTHRIGQYKIGNSNIFEQGAFCDVDKMEYLDALLVNSQKEGCILLTQDKQGNTFEDRTKLIHFN